MIKKSIITTSLPNVLFNGAKTDVGAAAAQLSAVSTLITKGVLIRCDSLGGGTYIKIGNATSQNVKVFNVVGEMLFMDWINNLNKIYVITDGANAAVSYIGG